MTQTLELEMTTIPAARRALPAAPVLIRVPALPRATAGAARPRPRRRLRREVRVAGYWLLAVVPASVACAAWGGAARPAVLLTVPPPGPAPAAVAAAPAHAPERGITLSLEPAHAEAEPCQVFLTGQILPLDAEESTHGGH